MTNHSNEMNGIKMKKDDTPVSSTLPWWTWIAPLVIAHIGTQLSLWFKTDPGTSLWYLPTALGIVMVYWWGPRALTGIYLNALLCAPLWDLPWKWSFLYALPETLEVGLSWFIFVRLMRGSVWLPNRTDTVQFLAFGSVLPAVLANIYLVIQLILLGDIPRSTLWDNWVILFSADLATHLVLAVPMLILFTKSMCERGWAKINGEATRVSLLPENRNSKSNILLVALIFISIFVLVTFTSIQDNWIIYGVFMVILAIRYGVNIAVIASSWTGTLALLLPPILKNQLGLPTATYSDVLVFNLQVLFLCAVSLLIGRAVSDLFNEISERKHVEASLRESEERWQFALEGSGNGVWDWNPQTNNVFYSRHWKEILGFDEQDIGDTLGEWDKRVHPDDYEYVYNELNRHFSGQTPVYITEHRVRCKDGSYKWILDRGKVIQRDQDGKPVRVIGTHADITERKQAEEQLRLQKALLESASEVSLDGIAIVSPERKWLHHNQRFVEMWKVPPDVAKEGDSRRAVEATYKQVRDPENYLATLNYLYEHMDISVHDELTFNDDRVFERYTGPVRGVDGAIYGRIWHYRDITERRRSEKELRDSEELHRTTLSNISDAVFITDDDGNFTYICLNVHVVFDYSHEEVAILGNIKKLLGTDLFNLEELDTRGEIQNIERTINTKTGIQRVLLVNVKRVSIRNGTVLYTCHDITERRRAQKALQESEERFRLLSDVSMEGIQIHDNGVILDANLALAKQLGYHSPDELIGKQIMQKHLTAESFKKMRETIANETEASYEVEGIRTDGTHFPVEVTAYTLNLNGKDVRIASTRDITKRKQAESALKQSQARLQLALDAGAIATWDWDIVNDLVYGDDRLAGLFGFDPQLASAGLSLSDFVHAIHPEDRADVEARITQAVQTSRVYTSEYRVMNRNNEYRWVVAHGQVERDANGNAVRFPGALLDITERKQAEEKIRESEERYRNLFNSMEEGIAINEAIFDENGDVVDYVILDVNPAFERHAPYTIEEALGKRATELYKMSPEFIRNWWKEHSKMERTAQTEYYHEASNRWMFISTTIPENNRFATIFFNITERKQAEERLSQSEERFSLIFRSNPAAMALTDRREGKYTDVNEAFCKLFGFSRAEIIGHDAVSLGIFTEENRQRNITIWNEKGMIRDVEMNARNRSGAELYLLASVEEINIHNEPQLLMIIVDITERKRVENALQSAQARLRTVIEGMPIMMDAFDDQGLTVMWNAECERVTGYRTDEVVGNPDAMSFLYPDAEYREKMIKEWTVRGNDYRNWAWEVTCKDGTKRTIEWSNVSERLPIAGWSTWGIGVDITERKRAEEALQESEQRFSMLSAATFEGIVISDRGHLVDVNEQLAVMFGYERLEMTGLEVKNFVAPESWELVQKHIRSGSEDPYEHLGLRKDGSKFPVEIRARSLPYKNQIFRVTAIRDITERKRAEDALRAAEANYRSIFENAPVGIFQSSPEGRYISVNSAMAHTYGYETEEEMIEAVTDISAQIYVDPAHRAEFARQVEQQGVLERFENQNYRKDGTIIWTITNARAAHDADGRLTHYEGFVLDISKSKQAEEKIQRQNQRLKVLREIDTAILAADSVDNIVGAALGHIRELIDCQRTSITLIDWEKEEAMLFDLRTVGKISIPKGTRGPLTLFEDILPTLSQNQTVLINDLTAVPDPSPRIQNGIREGMRSLCNLPLLSQGNLIGIFNLVSEIPGFFDEEKVALGHEVANQIAIAITQNNLLQALREFNAELEQRVLDRTAQLQVANKELEAFSYSVSHDLRAPLRGIDGFSKALERKYGDSLDEDGRHYLTRIQENANRMAELIDDLLSLSRITRREIKRERADLSKMAQEILEDLQMHEPERRVEFKIEEQVEARGDAGLLKIVLDNLLGNAFKFTSKREVTKIEFGVFPSPSSEKDSETIYVVRDNGVGFDMTYTEKLFGVFQRLHRIDEFPGTGVGLATVQRIIQRHGGRIWAEAEVDKGAVFYFTIGADHEK